MCFTALLTLILIQVLDAKLEAEQNDRSRKRAKNSEKAKDPKPATKKQPKKATAKSQKVQTNTSDAFLELQRTRVVLVALY